MKKRIEGIPIWGRRYDRYVLINERLRSGGPEAIQKEIRDLWVEIQLRTEALAEWKGPARAKRLTRLNGWEIRKEHSAPTTRAYSATKQGVRMGAGTYEALLDMIKNRHTWRGETP